MIDINIKTAKNKEVVNITKKIEQELPKSGKGVVNVFVKHTTCAITTADLDPGTDLDFIDFLEKVVPAIKFRHPHDPSHTSDHLLSSVIGAGLSLPFKDKSLILGTWQRVVLVEFDGPRERNIVVSIIYE